MVSPQEGHTRTGVLSGTSGGHSPERHALSSGAFSGRLSLA
jgi:hypothetical protein